MARKIDPLNKKLYGSVTAMLTVTDVKAAAAFYQKAFGFAKRGIMNGPDGKAIHAELTLRGTTLMLGPEMAQMGSRSAKTIGASPTSLYLLTEKVDKTVAKAVKLGAVRFPIICSQIRVTLCQPGVLTPCLSISMAFSNLFNRVSSFLASVIQRQYSLRWV